MGYGPGLHVMFENIMQFSQTDYAKIVTMQ
jgi:hypothetical protein